MYVLFVNPPTHRGRRARQAVAIPWHLIPETVTACGGLLIRRGVSSVRLEACGVVQRKPPSFLPRPVSVSSTMVCGTWCKYGPSLEDYTGILNTNGSHQLVDCVGIVIGATVLTKMGTKNAPWECLLT